MRYLKSATGNVWLLVVLVLSGPGLMPAIAQLGDREDGMRFIPDVPGQFRALTEFADPLGFNISTTPNPSSCRHYQGIARVDGSDGTPFFYVTRSGNTPDIPYLPDELVCDDSPGERRDGNLVVFRMGSREKNGERLRSNRLAKGVHVNNTAPPPEDVATIYFTVVGGDDPSHPDPCMRPGLLFREGFVDQDGDGTNDCSTPPPHVYQHPGGMQRVGNMLALATDGARNPLAECLAPCALVGQQCIDLCIEAYGDYEMASSPSRVMFFDVSTPEDPIFKSQYVPIDENGYPLENADGIAVTPLPGGRYLMAVTPGFDNDPFYFYRSTTTSLASPDLSWEFIAKERIDDPYPEDAHQSIHFLREGDINGTLYLAGARGHPVWDDHDRIDLYIFNCDTPDCAPGDQVDLVTRYQGQRIIPGPSTLGTRLANLAAATGFHETPSGELLFYATEHDNDGPNGSVKAGEWRHSEIVRENSPTLLPSVEVNGPYTVDEGSNVSLSGSAGQPKTRAWIQLYTGVDYDGLYPVVDYSDHDLDNFDNFALLEPFPLLGLTFNDTAHSWKWYAPVGCSIEATDFYNGAVDEVRTLAGTGGIERDPNLSLVLNDGGTDDINAEIDKIDYLQNCDTYYPTPVALKWDLDLNGSYETTGSPVSFSAAAIDGPGSVQVPAQAQHPSGGSPGMATATVNVLNVAPLLSNFSLTDSAGHQIGVDVPFVLTRLPVTVAADFADPGVLDHQTAVLIWGDGTVDPQTAFETFDEAFGDGAGEAGQKHRYTVPGLYSVMLTVTDDDFGADSESKNVRVVTPEQAVNEIVASLDSIIAATKNPVILTILQKARKALTGSIVGTSSNGALAMIQTGNNASAITFLTEAIEWLKVAQKGGANVGTLITLLQQVSAALAAA